RQRPVERVLAPAPQLLVAARAARRRPGWQIRQALQEVTVRAADQRGVGQRLVVHVTLPQHLCAFVQILALHTVAASYLACQFIANAWKQVLKILGKFAESSHPPAVSAQLASLPSPRAVVWEIPVCRRRGWDQP